MARTAADALAVLALARIAGCVEGDAVPLDVAPLFETVADLEAATSVMRALFDDPVYRAHLRTRGDRQTVMLRSEARRVGKEWVRTCRSRGSPYYSKTQIQMCNRSAHCHEEIQRK